MVRILRAEVDGPDARLGHVPAADIARLIIGLERALARAAYVALGTTRGPQSGRHRLAIEQASRLRFLGVEAGSVIGLLALPDLNEPDPDSLPIAANDLSGAALAVVMRAIGAGTDEVDVELASALAQLGDELGVGERNNHVGLAVADPDASVAPTGAVRLDRGVRERMHAIAQRPQQSQDDTVVGTLVEADFERETARLQPPLGSAVVVTFPKDMADDIYNVLRHPAQLQGRVRFDRKTASAREIELHRITRPDQLTFDSQAFFAEPTVSDLATQQGVAGPVADPASLSDPELSEEERAAFLAPLSRA